MTWPELKGEAQEYGRRQIIKYLGAAAASSAIAGCSESQYDENNATQNQGGDDTTKTEATGDLGRLTMALGTNQTEFDPAVSFDNSVITLGNVYEPLLWFNKNGNNEIQPALAKSYDVNDAGTKWTFSLKHGVEFHHGYGELTATDVKFSIERMLSIGRGPAYLWAPVKSIETPDDYTVIFNLEYKYPLDLIAAAPFGSWIYSKKGAEDIGSSVKDQQEWFNKGNDLGTGPYTIDSWQRSQHVRFSQFSEYRKGWEGSHFTKPEFQFVPEASTRVQMIQGGDAQLVQSIPPSLLSKVENDSNVDLLTRDSYVQLIAQLNTQIAPTDDPKVRQALLHAFPYEAGIEEIRQGYGYRNAIPVPRNLPGHNDELEPPEYDLNKAQSLIDESSYNRDELTLNLTHIAGGEAQRRTAQTLKAELSSIGVTLEVKNFPWPTMWARAKNLDTAPNAFLYQWWPTYPSPFANLWDLFNSWEEGQQPIFNLTYWQNKEYDQLLLEGQELMATNREKGLEKMREAQRMVHEAALAFTFWDVERVYPVNSQITGFEPNPAYPEMPFFYDMSSE